MNERMNECVFVYRTYHIMSRGGLQLPFAEYPSQCFLTENNRSVLQHPQFMAEAISELLPSDGCIVDVPPFDVNR